MRRRRILAEHLHGYEDRAQRILRRLVDLEIMEALPDDAARRMEGLNAEIRPSTGPWKRLRRHMIIWRKRQRSWIKNW